MLAADRTAADDHDTGRRGTYLEHTLGIEDVRVVKGDPGRVERPGSGRDEHGFAVEHSPEAAGCLNDHVAVWPQRGGSRNQLDLVAGDVVRRVREGGRELEPDPTSHDRPLLGAEDV